MKRILVCSDIHGEIDKLENVLDEANYNPKEDQLILLGDYIDRGYYSKQVVECVMRLVKDGAIALLGNHEELFINAMQDEEEWERWIKVGGGETVESYHGDMELMREHAEWMRLHLRYYHETEDYIFVHAGLRPDEPLEWQTEEDMLWIRHTNHIGLGKLVVHGHTPMDEVFHIHDQLFIDTKAAYGGKLSLVELPSMMIYED